MEDMELESDSLGELEEKASRIANSPLLQDIQPSASKAQTESEMRIGKVFLLKPYSITAKTHPHKIINKTVSMWDYLYSTPNPGQYLKNE